MRHGDRAAEGTSPHPCTGAGNEAGGLGIGSMRKRIIAALAAALAVAIVALPAGAGNPNATPTGIGLTGLLHTGDRTFSIQANTPFFVRNKFVVDDPNAGYCGGAGQPVCDTSLDVQQSSITLTVNGKAQNAVITTTLTDTKPKSVYSKEYLFNFPSGLAANADGSPARYVFVETFTIRGQDVLVSPTNVDAVVTCQYGTIQSGQGAGLLCAGQPSP